MKMAEKETWDSAFMSSFTPSDQTRKTNLVALWLSWSKFWCFKIAAFQEGAFASAVNSLSRPGMLFTLRHLFQPSFSRRNGILR